MARQNCQRVEDLEREDYRMIRAVQEKGDVKRKPVSSKAVQVCA